MNIALSGKIHKPTISGKIVKHNISGAVSKIILPTDAYYEKNYIETFSGDLFKNSTRLANWNTEDKKINFINTEDMDISLFSEYARGSYYSNVLSGFFSTDGTKYFNVVSTGAINRFPVSVPFDVTTIGTLEQTYSLSWQGLLRATTMSDDGLKLYSFYIDGKETYLRQLDLNTSWDLNSAVDNNKVFNFSWYVNVLSMNLNPDGSKLFIFDADYADLIEYNLSPNYEIVDMEFGNYLEIYSLIGSELQTMQFTRDGNSVILINNSYSSDYSSHLYQINLTNSWDIGSAEYYSTLTLIGPINCLYFKPGTDFVFYNFTIYPKEYRPNLEGNVISKSIAKNTTGINNEYKHVTLYANGTNLDDITFYIGENNNSTITYTELPTTGNTTARQSQRVALTNTNKYGLNWKAVGSEGSEITRLRITYEKE